MSGKPKVKPSLGWGGKRAGSGKPKNPVAAPIARPVPTKASAAVPLERPVRTTDQSPQDRARAGLDLAFATLEHIEMNGVTEGARVSAAKIIIETAIGKPGKDATEAVVAKPVDKWGAMLDETRPN